VQKSEFHLQSGHALLKEYESSLGKYRVFCSQCGSPVYSRTTTLSHVQCLRMGLLDTPLEVRPVAPIYASSHAGWEAILDALPQYEAGLPS
jgi:hypothetical protein